MIYDSRLLSQLYRPKKDSHKGDNGKLLLIGGSELFHAAAFWAAEIASRIVDLVHFSSPAMENNKLVRQRAKAKFWNGIVVPWDKVEDYIREDDCVVIGPGMVRSEGSQVQKTKGKGRNLQQAARADDTKVIVDTLLKKYSSKRWVIDGGALQEVEVKLIPKSAILTPHQGEFEGLLTRLAGFNPVRRSGTLKREGQVRLAARELGCTILLKGPTDVVCKGHKCVEVPGGNEGMTKGGTGDVLAGLVGALYCRNEAFLAAVAGSYINKKAGDSLYERVGPFFNATDLVNEVPEVMKEGLDY